MPGAAFTESAPVEPPAARPAGWLVRGFEAVALALYGAFVVATGVLAYLMPLAGDDFEAIRISRANPGLPAWAAFWYSHLFGRVPAIVTGYYLWHSSLLFALLASVTLPLLAFLTTWLALGRRPSPARKDLAMVGFLTVALWFSLPLQWDVFWRSGWPNYALPAMLMLAFLIPYRAWAGGGIADGRGATGLAAGAGMLALGALAGSSSESVLAVLTLLAAAVIFYALARRPDAALPARLWAGLAGLAIGAAVLLAAPGNSARAAQTGDLTLSLRAHIAAVGVLASRTLFVWLVPAYPWLACVLLAAVAVSAREGHAADARLEPRMSRVWLAASALVALPLIAFPQVTDLAGERTVLYTMLFLFLAAVSLLSPEAEPRAIDRIPRAAGAIVLAALLLVALGDVAVNIRYAKGIDSEVATRAQLIAEKKAQGQLVVVLPPLQHGAVGTTTPIRAILWGDVGGNASDWLNRSIASYYGVRSIATTTSPAAGK